MEFLLIAVVALVVLYLVVNGKRNSDPLNRKCAAEICEYLVASGAPNVEGVQEIFMRNARYQAQANHVLSMVPTLLMRVGYSFENAQGVVPLLREAVALIPR